MIGDWRLEIGDWRLEIGDWRPKFKYIDFIYKNKTTSF